MKKIISYTILFIVLVGISFGIYFLFFKSEPLPNGEVETVKPSIIPNFFKKNTNTTTDYKEALKEGDTVTVVGVEESVRVLNFYKTATFITKRGDAEIASTEKYTISYVADPPYFTIVITSEDVDTAIRDAENKLVSLLGIKKNDICKLEVLIGVEKSFDPEGKWLGPRGLSFCPSR